ncbi:hypothetical protein KC669_01840 [Candidatus Dojkabacteria bacterium]|uniref:Uncharacterized protein n=1 Tax=Candidatus Dojkabacteria bacterium TaxID=2099670 RepID=A0A955L9Y3_9BACT|nr:hypothetical protein [Candidatus Dojkabacteria bacterium]
MSNNRRLIIVSIVTGFLILAFIIFIVITESRGEQDIPLEDNELLLKISAKLNPFEEGYVELTNNFNSAIQTQGEDRLSSLENIKIEVSSLTDINATLLSDFPELENLAKTDAEKEFYTEVYTLVQIYEKQLTKDWPTLIQIESSSDVEGLSADGLNYARQMESERELQVKKLLTLKDQL